MFSQRDEKIKKMTEQIRVQDINDVFILEMLKKSVRTVYFTMIHCEGLRVCVCVQSNKWWKKY